MGEVDSVVSKKIFTPNQSNVMPDNIKGVSLATLALIKTIAPAIAEKIEKNGFDSASQDIKRLYEQNKNKFLIVNDELVPAKELQAKFNEKIESDEKIAEEELDFAIKNTPTTSKILADGSAAATKQETVESTDA